MASFLYIKKYIIYSGLIVLLISLVALSFAGRVSADHEYPPPPESYGAIPPDAEGYETEHATESSKENTDEIESPASDMPITDQEENEEKEPITPLIIKIYNWLKSLFGG